MAQLLASQQSFIQHLFMLEPFLRNPHERLYLTEASRELNISSIILKGSLDLLVHMGLLIRKVYKSKIIYQANEKSEDFKYFRTAYNISLIKKEIS
jgi:hypothetical protein